MSDVRQSASELSALVELFYDSTEVLASFIAVSPHELPADYRTLLAHEHHMTVAVEAFHRSAVDVQVLARRRSQSHYARKILLARRTDGRVVQFGIMRVNLAYLEDPVRAEIESERVPLGRTLIEHGVLRQVHLVSLWHVMPGAELCQHFSLAEPVPTFGRAAAIDCNGERAVELLEIVAPIAPVVE